VVSRVPCDARILSIFKGAAKLQAQVIAGRLPSGRNQLPIYRVGALARPREGTITRGAAIK
jgi:hypothetical protein